jgi:hypothetical protein
LAATSSPETPIPPHRLADVRVADLKDMGRLLDLHGQGVTLGVVTDSKADQPVGIVIETMMTTLLDPQPDPKPELAELYRRSCQVERVLAEQAAPGLDVAGPRAG